MLSKRATRRLDQVAAPPGPAGVQQDIEFALQDLEHPSVILASPEPDIASAAATAGLASRLALSGLRIVLMDADLSNPALHHLFGVQNDLGLSTVLTGGEKPSSCMHFVPLADNGTRRGFYLVPAGPTSDRPHELLESARTSRFLRSLEEQADLVVIAVGPVLRSDDSLVLGRRAGGALLVVAPGRTTTAAVDQARRRLSGNQVRLVGAVMSDGRSSRR